MVDQTHAEKDKYPINILFILSSYRIVIELDDNYQLYLEILNLVIY